MRIISSQVALRAVVALAAAGELTLSELAYAVGATPSAAQRALSILRDDAIVERRDGRGAAYELTAAERAVHILALAIEAVPVDTALAISARANRAFEFMARAEAAVVVVFAAGSTARDQARAARSVEALATRQGSAVEYLDHDDVRRRLLAEPALRTRMAHARVLHGTRARSFPDRSGHGLRQGRPLHRPHRSVLVPSVSALRRIARRHGVGRLSLFGSAVRSDFRADSDIDVLLRFREGAHPTLRSLLDLERALETAFGRDVDLVREELLGPEARARVDHEAVALL